jgi:DNA-binding NarL/FixJ family response regulator
MIRSSIEKNKLDNIDLVQMEYFTDLIISEKDIVVIESNNTIAITIRKFLINLGFENIHVCKEVKEGIEVFSHFISKDIVVPIIIDSISNKNNEKIITEILQINPNAKIIIITTKEKTDHQLLKLYDIGIYSILHKPLRFNDFKKSFSYIIEKNEEVEEGKKNEEVEEGKKNEEVEEVKITNNLESLLLSHNKITHNKFKDVYNVEQSEVENIIKNAIENRKIILDKEILEATCNQCNSTNITYTSECPKCNGINFKQKDLIEHYGCGEIYPKETDYKTCPKCNKQIGSAGTDYREFADYYICPSCNDKFPNPLFKFTCFDCNNVFLDKLASWKKNKLYKIQI